MKKYDRYDKLYFETFSEYFTALRTKNGKTYEQVALDLGLRPSTFYHYERGLRDCPISVIKAMSEYYGKNFYEVFETIGNITDEKMAATEHLYSSTENDELTKAELLNKIAELEKKLGNK